MVLPDINLAHQSVLVKGKNTLIAGVLLMFLSVFFSILLSTLQHALPLVV